MTNDQHATSTRLIALSVWAALAWAVVALAWGLAVSSQMIVFDGLYSLISVLLSTFSLLAVRVIRQGPSERFPFGRQALEPLTIMVKAVAIGALCVYAVTGAIIDIADGGREVDAGWALGYAVAATLGSGLLTLYLRRRQRDVRSDLVRAEVMQWFMDTVLSAGVAIGFVIAVVLERAGRDELAAYVDPAMVALVAGIFLVMPVRLLAEGLREVLAMAPPAELDDQVRARVLPVEMRHGFEESFVRVAKIGSQLDIEIDLVVGEGTAARTVDAFDEIRQEIADALDGIGYEQWLTISFTADRRWAR